MDTSTFSFPHPVLGLSDDVEGEITLEIQVERLKDSRSIRFVYKNIGIDNKYFTSLIETGKARIVTKVYCSSTFKTWTFEYSGWGFEIPEDDLINKAEVHAYILASDEINEYRDDSFNKDFDGVSFSISKNDIIGVLGKVIVPVDKQYEQLGLGNIFEFVPLESNNEPCTFDYHTNKIIIKYPITPEGSHPPNALFHSKPWTAYNIFIVPALIEAFRLKADPERKEEVKELEWSIVLDTMLPEEERADDPFSNAQLILNREIPVMKAFVELQKN